MATVLTPAFFHRPAEVVAPDLLGKILVRQLGNQNITATIIETEAYVGAHDKACHAFRGKTARTEVLFGDPGIFYVHLCYGIHQMLNIVTNPVGWPAGVLIRGIKVQSETISGPGRVTKLLSIDSSLNRKEASLQNGLWFEDHGNTIPKRKIIRTARIGVEYAGPVWSKRKLRFLVAT